MLSLINQIKNVKTAEKVFASLNASYTQRVGEKAAEYHDWMCTNGSQYKPNGLSWWKERCRNVAQNIVSRDSTVNHFIPASPETEAWGGFLGGERVVYTDKNAKEASEEMLSGRINQMIGAGA